MRIFFLILLSMTMITLPNGRVIPLSGRTPVTVVASCKSNESANIFDSLNERETSRAKGVILRKGIVMTTHHKMRVTCDFKVNGKNAFIKAANESDDVLILSVPGIKGKPIAYAKNPQIGDLVYLNSCITDECELVPVGRVRELTEDFVCTTFLSSLGDSGEGMYTRDGVLIGAIKGLEKEHETGKPLGAVLIPAHKIEKIAD